MFFSLLCRQFRGAVVLRNCGQRQRLLPYLSGSGEEDHRGLKETHGKLQTGQRFSGAVLGMLTTVANRPSCVVGKTGFGGRRTWL